MATQLQLRKGTKVQNDVFTGAEGEVTYDTTSKGLRVHDGVTQGGHIIDTVIEFQIPTAENNYTWYRKYSSGWVEQGGVFTISVSSRLGYYTVVMPITMSNINYTLTAQGGFIQNVSAMAYNVNSKTTTSFVVQAAGIDNTSASGTPNQCSWQVSGMAA